MTKIILLNKPHLVVCQFSPSGDKATLQDYITDRSVYPAGRLDHDSEGLVVLTDDGKLQNRISAPEFKLEKTYWVQVEGDICANALKQLAEGVTLKDGRTRPAIARKIDPPQCWDRNPPVRYRKHIPTSWISLTITEGRNRQVRRMTASVGYPTLRLIRKSVGLFELEGLAPGESRLLSREEVFQASQTLHLEEVQMRPSVRRPDAKHRTKKRGRHHNGRRPP